MILLEITVGSIIIVVFIMAVLFYVGKRANDKDKMKNNASQQGDKPIMVTVYSSKMRQALSSCKKHPSKMYGQGVMVSGKGPSLPELINMKKKAIKDQESAEKRKLIKQVSSGDRKKSFADEIEIAQSVILRGAIDNKLLKPEQYQKEAQSKPSQSMDANAAVSGRSTVVNVTKDKLRPGIVDKKRSTVIDIEKTQSTTYNVKNEGSKLDGTKQNLPIASGGETSGNVQGERRDSDVIFAHALIVGGTTRKAQLRKVSEAGKVVKALSGRRGSTLADDLQIGRSVIFHEGENRIEQHKSAENRKVIKRVTSNQVVRKKSLQENIKFAKSVILPSESSQSQDEKARKNRRIIQVASQVSTERRRSSLLDQVKFARSVINQPAAPSTRRSVISTESSFQDNTEFLSSRIRHGRLHGHRRSSVFSSSV